MPSGPTRKRRGGQESARRWALPLLIAVVAVAIWLAIVVIKWLFILAVVAGVIWLLLLLRRRVAT